MSLCVGSLRGTAWGSSSFFCQFKLHWFLQPKVMGTYLPVTGTLGWGAWCGAGTPPSQDILPEFLSTTSGCGTRPFHICAPPTDLDGYGFFNSVVVRLPFNSISDGSEWRLFYVLVLILMKRRVMSSYVTILVVRSSVILEWLKFVKYCQSSHVRTGVNYVLGESSKTLCTELQKRLNYNPMDLWRMDCWSWFAGL